jgi:thiamine monophosphate synthase
VVAIGGVTPAQITEVYAAGAAAACAIAAVNEAADVAAAARRMGRGAM